MSMTRRPIPTGFSLSALILAASLLAVPALAEFEEEHTLQAEQLVLRNLIGEIRVEGHDGEAFGVHVAARGRDSSRDNLTIEVEEGSSAEVNIEFPLDRETRYVYPPMGPRSQTRFSMSNEGEGVLSFLSRLFGSDSSSIRVSGKGSGMELWADVTIRVPRGAHVVVENGVGKIFAREVEGDVSLDGSASEIEASAIRGDLSIDTGSGKVTVEEVAGDVLVDTGSGRVGLVAIEGERVDVDTGSGHVRLDSVRAASVVVDTGSGSVELRLPVDASATIRADTGSGGINVDFEGARVDRHDRHEAEIVIGAGAARFDLDTGSGSIRILQLN
jgi:hypothetical protein